MDGENNTKEPRSSPWQKLVKLCKELQPVIAISALILAGLSFLGPYVRSIFWPQIGWGNSTEIAAVGEAPKDGFITAWLEHTDDKQLNSVNLEGRAGPTPTSLKLIASDSASRPARVMRSSISFPVRSKSMYSVTVEPFDMRKELHVYWTPLERR